MRAWESWLVQRRERKAQQAAQLVQAKAHHARKLREKCLAELARVTRWEREHRLVFSRLRTKFGQRLQLRCLNSWKAFLVYRRKLHSADAHARKVHARNAVRFWRASAERRLRRDERYRRAARRSDRSRWPGP